MADVPTTGLHPVWRRLVALGGVVLFVLGVVVMGASRALPVTGSLPTRSPSGGTAGLFAVLGLALALIASRRRRAAAWLGAALVVLAVVAIGGALADHQAADLFTLWNTLGGVRRSAWPSPVVSVSVVLLALSVLAATRGQPSRTGHFVIVASGALAAGLGLGNLIADTMIFNLGGAQGPVGPLPALAATGLLIAGPSVAFLSLASDGTDPLEWSAILAAVAGITVSFLISFGIEGRETSMIVARTRSVAAGIGTQVQAALAAPLGAVNDLARWTARFRATPDDWRFNVRLAMAHNTGLTAVALMDSGPPPHTLDRYLVGSAFPPAPSLLEGVMAEADTSASAVVWDTVTRTLVSASTVAGTAGRRQIVGLVDPSSVLAAVTRRNDLTRYVIGLETANGGDIAGAENPGDRYRQNAPVTVAGLTWRVEVTPSDVLIRDERTSAPGWALLLGFMTSALLAAALYFGGVVRRRARQLEGKNRDLEGEIGERLAAEDRLRRSEERQRLLMEEAGDAIVLHDRAGTVQWVNRRMSELVGWTRDELVGMNVRRLISPADLERRPLKYEAAFEGRTVRGERRFMRRDGSSVMVDVSARSSDGETVTAIVRDMTERHQAEEARRRLAAIVESSEDAIIGKTPDGIITSWNLGAQRMYGYTAGEMIGRHISTLVPGDHMDELREILRKVAEGDTVENLETERIAKDGVRLHVALTVSPIRDDAGRVNGASTIARNITDRKEAEAELRRREAEFRALIENASDGITVVDAEGVNKFESPSAVRLTGYAPQELVGRNAFDFVHPDDLDRARQSFQQVLGAPRAVVTVQLRFRHAGGEDRVFECRLANMLHEPAIAGIVVNTRDVTDRMRLEDQLRQSQKMEAVGRLAGGIAHDFNNILSVVTGHASLLRDELPEGDMRSEVEEIERAAERAAGLTRQLLAFGRKQVRQPRVLRPADIVGELAPMLQRSLGEHIQLRMALDSDSGYVVADPSQLQQVALNLAINARDAMPDGGMLTIEVDDRMLPRMEEGQPDDIGPGSYVRIAIHDTGTGIPAAYLAKIFDPFFTTKEPGKGTGLGLSTVYGIVHQSGGRLSVETEVGQGTTFEVYLPVAGPQPAPGPAAD